MELYACQTNDITDKNDYTFIIRNRDHTFPLYKQQRFVYKKELKEYLYLLQWNIYINNITVIINIIKHISHEIK